MFLFVISRHALLNARAPADYAASPATPFDFFASRRRFRFSRQCRHAIALFRRRYADELYCKIQAAREYSEQIAAASTR